MAIFNVHCYIETFLKIFKHCWIYVIILFLKKNAFFILFSMKYQIKKKKNNLLQKKKLRFSKLTSQL